MKVLKVTLLLMIAFIISGEVNAQLKSSIDFPDVQTKVDPALAVMLKSSTTVVFNDSNFEKVIREALGIPSGPVTDADMATLTQLTASEASISDITGIEYAVNLQILNLRKNSITDLSPLQNLYALSYLFLDHNYTLSNIQPLGNLANLMYLSMSNNSISDISALQYVPYLMTLNLGNNQIASIAALQNHNMLQTLLLGNNQISDISALQTCPSINTLYLHVNQIQDISVLANLPNLADLYLTTNQISDISSLQNLTNLVSLAIHTNQISDLTPLQGLTGLGTLVINNNQISNLSPLQNLSGLTTLYLGYNNISEVSAISGLTGLTNLKLDGNHLDNGDLPSFYDLDNLEGLDLSANPGITSGTAMQTLGDNLDILACEDIVWDGVCGQDPTPVELSAFTVNEVNGNVHLEWKTESETNSFGFEIEKSRNKNSFERIGFVQGKGTTTTPEMYNFIDENVTSGTNYYRLRQVDFDGQFEYSDILEIVVEAPAEYKLSQNYPNPFNSSTMISFSVPEKSHVNITVFDITGKTVMNLTSRDYEAGSYQVLFNAGDLASGSYFYKLTAGNYSQVQKLIILK